VQNRYIFLPLFGLTPDGGVPLGRSPKNFYRRVTDGKGPKWRRNIAENFNRLSRVHERYRRQTTDIRTHDDIANVNALGSILALIAFVACVGEPPAPGLKDMGSHLQRLLRGESISRARKGEGTSKCLHLQETHQEMR